jgi:hypothetical protein
MLYWSLALLVKYPSPVFLSDFCVDEWEIGLGSLFEEDVPGGVCIVVDVSTLVIVYVYLSVVTGIDA